MNLNTKRIEIIIAEQGLTRGQLADKSNITRQNLSTILRRGTAEPRTVGKIASGLGVSPADLVD